MSFERRERAVVRLEALKQFHGSPWETEDYNEGMNPPCPLWGMAIDEYFNPPERDEET